jgi:hypothetical protein
MRLDFKVLWVDDQPGAVDAQMTAIAAGMQEEGFELVPFKCASLDETRNFLGGDVFNDEIDLVLVDWDLGGGVEGQDAIAEIRESIQYKDVVFYSANNNAAELRRLAFEAGLEGVYCASRAGLVEEVLGVFESLVKKVLDLDHTRGIVMGATSDIDHLVRESVTIIHAKLGNTEQEAMIKDALGIIETRISEHTKKLAALRKTPTLAALLEAQMLFTANDRLRTLGRVLDQETFNAHAASRKAVKTYIQDVVPKRNNLGHKVLLPDGRTAAIMAVDGEQISLEEMRSLRKSILELRGEFRGLHQALSA